jgi:multisubunit Na+/H+ antiporter MnhE subunit
MNSLLVSPLTVVTIIVGVIISAVYLYYMWRVLLQVARTIDEPDDGRPDSFGYSFAGAIVAVAASWLAIAAYGFGPQLLYVGVILALLSPIAVSYTFYRELHG